MLEVASAWFENKQRTQGPWLHAGVLGVFALYLIACGGGGSGSGPDGSVGRGGGDPRDGGAVDAAADGSFVDTTLTCGNGKLDPAEACDDGNALNGDGCSADCRNVERTFVCSDPNQPCVSSCGNGALDPTEACDDRNLTNDDGCSSTCEVEVGWGCARPGAACVRLAVCGNGVRERGEECDSGSSSDPGCVDCKIQDGYWCTTAGQACMPKVCGNGMRTPGEDCDDNNTKDGDGCSKSCKVESGFRCTPNGCSPICGDGQIKGRETCEDGNIKSGDGCSAGCVTEPGYNCETLPCKPAVCGNSKVEGGEGCDDGNTVGGDGCGPTCQNEPTVVVGPSPMVQTHCGDGLVTSGEACDDGNMSSGDGCSKDCKVEAGFTCQENLQYPAKVQMKVTYRDFKGRDDSANVHPHMKQNGDVGPPAQGTDSGIVGAVCKSSNAASCGRLDANGKPELHAGTHNTIDTNIGTAGMGNFQAAHDAFALWYTDSNPNNLKGPTNDVIAVQVNPTPVPAGGDYLELTRDTTTNAYSYENSEFYPLGKAATGTPAVAARGFGFTTGQTKNFHFTTELRSFFQYRGGETLTFYGDDDVWVFINGRLAVDIGGIHGQQWGRVVLGDDGNGMAADDSDCSVSLTSDGANTGATPPACTQSTAESNDNTDSRFSLVKGQVYEIALFNAERHPTGSNFHLTLQGFLAPRSYCTPKCGDGKVVGWEACDSGSANVDNVYGVCNTTCSHMDYCGDNIKQSDHESCDNGFNVDFTSGSSDACAPGCSLPPACGDGIVQAPNELCDNGADNDDTKYGGCTMDCNWGPYCGDGIVNGDELCDEGSANVSANEAGSCGYDCKPAYILL
jgi:fibro-slime domain-containing protein